MTQGRRVRAVVAGVILAGALTLPVYSEQVLADTSAPPTATAPPYVPPPIPAPNEVLRDGISDLSDCGSAIIDEGPDIALASLSASNGTLTVRLIAYYSNFFSHLEVPLGKQKYYIQFDARKAQRPVVSAHKTATLAFRFADVKSGKHKLFYAAYQVNDSNDVIPPTGHGACFTVK